MTASPVKKAAGISGRRKACVVFFLLGTALMVFAILGLVGGWYLLSESSPLNRASALKVTKEWGRLADFPAHSRIAKLDVQGSMFTRGFVVIFEAPAAEVEQWIKDSPGLSDAKTTTTVQEDGSTLYQVTPGGGAQFAEVLISASKKLVRIHVFWS